MVAIGRFHHGRHFAGDGVGREGWHVRQGDCTVPRQPVFSVQGPLTTHRLPLIGQQDPVSLSRLTVERVHAPRALVADGPIEQRPVGQPSCVLLNREQPSGLQRFEGETGFPLGPTHRVQRTKRFGLGLKDDLVGPVVMDDDDGMPGLLGFKGEMPQVGQHQGQFLLVVWALIGLP